MPAAEWSCPGSTSWSAASEPGTRSSPPSAPSATTSSTRTPPLEDLFDLVIHSERQLERAFWAQCLAGHVHADPLEVHDRLYRDLVRLIWTQRGLGRRKRDLLTRRLAALIFPVE